MPLLLPGRSDPVHILTLQRKITIIIIIILLFPVGCPLFPQHKPSKLWGALERFANPSRFQKILIEDTTQKFSNQSWSVYKTWAAEHQDLPRVPEVPFWLRKTHQLTTTSCKIRMLLLAQNVQSCRLINLTLLFFKRMLKEYPGHDKDSIYAFPSNWTWWCYSKFYKMCVYMCAHALFVHGFFIAAISRCSAFPHLYWEHCCLHLNADLQVRRNTRQGVANGKLEYDSYLKRLTFLLLCHCTL